MIDKKDIDAFIPALITPEEYIPKYLKIRDKVSNVIPFTWNEVQIEIQRIKTRAFKAGRPMRFIGLKARRLGFTTLEQGLNFYSVATRFNCEVLTLAHDNPTTEKIFRISNTFYEKLDRGIKPPRLSSHSKRELNFYSLQSLFSINTAGSRAPSRGQTLDRVHWSEVAWSPGDLDDQEKLLSGLTEAAAEGCIVLESTPNGVGNLFHQLVVDSLKGRGPWTLIFLPWFKDPTYRIAITDERFTEIRDTLSEEEKTLIKRFELDGEQIAWRRQKIDDMSVGSTARLFPQEYPEDPLDCFLVSGEHFFEIDIVQRLIKTGCPPPVERQAVAGERHGTGGEMIVFKQPVPGRKYIIGADVAGGGPRGNESVASAIDAVTCEQVAVLRGRWKPDVYGKHLAKFAHKYNDAMLAVERNNHGHSTLNTLVNDEHYPRLYHLIDYATSKRSTDVGWETNGRTRPVMLNELKQFVEKGWIIINDPIFLSQCLTFKLDRDEEKYKAAPGCLDDTVIANAIALQVRKDPDAKPIDVSNFVVDNDPERPVRMYPTGGRRIYP
jgi:hypothetical protein